MVNPSDRLPKGRRAPRKPKPKNLSKCDSSGIKSDNYDMDHFHWMEKMIECPVYHPSKEEFEDPLAYVHKISPEASKFGICKVIPPVIPSTPAGIVLMNEKKDFKFTTKVQPLRLPKWKNGEKGTFYMSGRNYSLCEFENMANKATARKYQISGCLPSSYVENEFWTEMIHRKKRRVEYGINVDGSAFSCSPHDPLSSSKWNLKTLPQQPRSSLRLIESPIPGVSEPMLYIGMLFSMFAWHVEDHYLYSINYHHCGAPKTWYGVSGYSALRFEIVVRKNIYNRDILSVNGEYTATFDLLSEKTTMFSPKILLQNDVPVYKAVQMPGEFVITFPQAYHAGFSHGFNCGEAVNFATGDWFSFGLEATTRYALLKRMPIIPFEELLCKEAKLLSNSSNHNLKVSFAFLMRLHHVARWFLKKFRKSVKSISVESQETIFCFICKRECYVAYVVCKCNRDPICLFHEREICNCRCGKSCGLYIREDIQELELVADMFEEEEEVHENVELQLKRDPFFLVMQNLSTSSEFEYIPSYSEVQKQ
ncbi:hypothetical protein ACJIZ3_022549 [Penstemon smallii]|uniref:Lysine-specific demethylase JMJ706-like n=1 Tax=Penstemon smallii TaxID=265156 RepID=A0ABD3TNV4_9LAMI